MTIELIISPDCPNAAPAREALRRACIDAGLEPAWIEWDRTAPDAPEHATRHGSPTILVDGVDVMGEKGAVEDTGCSCRIYRIEEGIVSGVPDGRMIVAAMLAGQGVNSK